MDSSEKWYSVKEAAHLMSVSVDTVRRWIQRKLLRAFRLPVRGTRRKRIYECWRIAESEIARFMRMNMNF